MYCKKCGKGIPNDANYCTYCGTNQGYCKKCGKEIPNDANYCTYCGTNQGNNNYEHITRIIDIIRKPVKGHKKIINIYLVWVVLHVYLYVTSLHIGKHHYSDGRCGWNSFKYADPSDSFYPFCKSLSDIAEGQTFHISFLSHVDVYDFSELFFYTIIFPLVIYGLVKIVPRCFRYCKSLSGRKRRS